MKPTTRSHLLTALWLLALLAVLVWVGLQPRP